MHHLELVVRCFVVGMFVFPYLLFVAIFQQYLDHSQIVVFDLEVVDDLFFEM